MNRRRTTPALLLTLAVIAPCGASPKVIIIGIDGLGPRGHGPAATPNLDAIADGSWAPGYRGAIAGGSFAGGIVGTPTEQATRSGPGWSSILTGTWVNKHGVSDNTFDGRDYENHPTLLEIAEEDDASRFTASAIQWDPIDTYLIGSVDDADSAMDYRSLPPTEAAVAADAAQVIATHDVDVMFVHLDDVDIVGHGSGISTDAYRAQIETTDGHVGVMLEALTARPNFHDEDWLVVVVSDHGHRFDGGHGGQSHLERTNTFIVSSQSVGTGYLPGTPAIVDVSATVLDHLGLAVPSNQEGTPRGAVVINPNFADGLVVHLPFDGTLADASGHGHDATIGGGAPTYAAGLHGSALVLDGQDDWITLGLPPDLSFGADTDFTVSLWISAPGLQPDDGDPAVISNKDWTNGLHDGWGLFMGGNGDDWKVNQAAAGSGGRVDTAWIDVHHTSGAPRFGHIAATFDRDGDLRAYRDGALMDTAPMEPGDVDAFALNIGQDGTGSYPHVFEGAIDDLAIWRRSLSADEIAILAMGRSFGALIVECTADVDGSGDVGFGDILRIIAAWGPCGAPCPEDLSANGVVDFADVLAVIAAWGACT
jgi:hypothetical protein